MALTFREIANELGLKTEKKAGDRTDYFCPRHDTDTGDLSVYHGSHFGCHGEGGSKTVSLLMHCKGWEDTEKAVNWMKEHFPDEFGEVDKEQIDRRKQARQVLDFAVKIAEDTLNKQQNSLKEQIKEKRKFTEKDLENYRIGYFSREDADTVKQRFDEQALKDSGMFKETPEGEIYSHLTNRILYPYLLDQTPVYAVGRRDYRKEEELWEASGEQENKEEVDKILENPDNHVEDREEARSKWIDQKLPKYKKTWNTDYNKHILYELRDIDSDKVIVTEGCADAISGHKSGFNVVSPVTTQFSSKDIDKVVRKTQSYDEVYLVNDGDERGQEGARKTAEELVKNGVEPFMVRLEEGMDLDDYTNENGYQLDQLLEDSEKYLQTLIQQAETRSEEATVKRKVFELIAEWSSIDRNPLFKDLPGSKREIKKEFKEWKEQEYESKKEDSSLEVEETVKEDDSVTSTLEIDDVEIRLNPVSQVRVHGLQKTVNDLKANDNGAIKPDTKFLKYSFSFGEGAEEQEYTLLTPPQESINPGDKFLSFKKADLSKKEYREHYKQEYNKLASQNDLEISFENFLKQKQQETFELAGELSEESREAVLKLDNHQVRELVETYLNNGFQYDNKLTSLVYPRIVVHDRKIVDPQDVMTYQPHSMFFTNTKVGKSFTTERVGQRRDDITPAGLVGYVSAEDGRKSGVLHEQTDAVFADEINFGSKQQLNDELLSLLEKGKVTQSKAGEDLITRFYGSLTYMANPVSDEDNVELTEKFLHLVEGLGNNVEAMGSRFGVILFDQDLDTVEGTPMDSNKRKKLATLVDWIKKETASEYSKIENQFQGWLSQEFPESYQDRIDGSKANIYSDKIYDFWEAHKESFRHARGQALRMAVYRNHLSDLLNKDYDLDEIREDAEEAFMDLQEINLDSIIRMNEKLDDEERMVQRSEAILEGTQPLYIKLFVKTCIAHCQRKESEWEKYDPFTSLSDTWEEIRSDLDEVEQGDRYYRWDKIDKQVSKNRVRKQDELSKRYGLHLTSEKDVDMVKVADSNIFTPFQKAYDFDFDDSDIMDNSDIESDEKNENVCASDEEDESSEEEHAHTNQSQRENGMSKMSKMSGLQPEVIQTDEENSDEHQFGYSQELIEKISEDIEQVDYSSIKECTKLDAVREENLEAGDIAFTSKGQESGEVTEEEVRKAKQEQEDDVIFEEEDTEDEQVDQEDSSEEKEEEPDVIFEESREKEVKQ